jgi:hypothetical protein
MGPSAAPRGAPNARELQDIYEELTKYYIASRPAAAKTTNSDNAGGDEDVRRYRKLFATGLDNIHHQPPRQNTRAPASSHRRLRRHGHDAASRWGRTDDRDNEMNEEVGGDKVGGDDGDKEEPQGAPRGATAYTWRFGLERPSARPRVRRTLHARLLASLAARYGGGRGKGGAEGEGDEARVAHFGSGAYAWVARLRGAATWMRVLRDVQAAPWAHPVLSRVVGGRGGSSPAALAAQPPDVLLKIVAVRNRFDEMDAYKESAVHQQVSSFRGAIELRRRSASGGGGASSELRRHAFAGRLACPLFLASGTLGAAQAKQLLLPGSSSAPSARAPAPAPHAARLHGGYRLTFMAPVREAQTLGSYLLSGGAVSEALYVRLERAVLTVWLAGYAHCDLHPHNVLLGAFYDGDGRAEHEHKQQPAIIDFGGALKLHAGLVGGVRARWARSWADPAAPAHLDGYVGARVREYAQKRVAAMGDPRLLNWEGALLRGLFHAFHLDAARVVAERRKLYSAAAAASASGVPAAATSKGRQSTPASSIRQPSPHAMRQKSEGASAQKPTSARASSSRARGSPLKLDD